MTYTEERLTLIKELRRTVDHGTNLPFNEKQLSILGDILYSIEEDLNKQKNKIGIEKHIRVGKELMRHIDSCSEYHNYKLGFTTEEETFLTSAIFWYLEKLQNDYELYSKTEIPPSWGECKEQL